MMISLTDKAKAKLRAFNVGDEKFLRISVVSGGCSGNTYDAQLDSELGEHDEVVYEEADLRIVADSRSALFLDGLHIDYSDDLIKAGFRLTNANAKASCGCGSSFSV